MPIAVDSGGSSLHVCEPVLPCSKAEHRRCSHIPEALPPTQCYSYTTTSSSRTALVPKARHLAKKTMGFSIWASDLESVQELKPHGSDSWRNLAFPEEHNSETPLRLPFPLNVTPLPQTLTDPLLNADSNDWLLLWCESFGYTITLLRCRLRAFYLGPADTVDSAPAVVASSVQRHSK